MRSMDTPAWSMIRGYSISEMRKSYFSQISVKSSSSFSRSKSFQMSAMALRLTKFPLVSSMSSSL